MKKADVVYGKIIQAKSDIEKSLNYRHDLQHSPMAALHHQEKFRESILHAYDQVVDQGNVKFYAS